MRLKVYSDIHVSLLVCYVGDCHAPAAELASQPPIVHASDPGPAEQHACQQAPPPAFAAVPAACCARLQLHRQLPSELLYQPVSNKH